METTTAPTGRGPVPVVRFLGLVLLGAAIGGVAALAAAGFVRAVLALNALLLISPRSRFMVADPVLLTLATVAVPTLGGLVVGLLHRRLPEGRPHTPADVIAAVQTRRGRLPAREGGVSALTALLSLGAGASVGQYGPLVHLGVIFRRRLHKRSEVGCTRETAWSLPGHGLIQRLANGLSIRVMEPLRSREQIHPV